MGCWLTALGTWADSALAVVAGFADRVVGRDLLARADRRRRHVSALAARRDLLRPRRRAFGAILGPVSPARSSPAGRAERERPRPFHGSGPSPLARRDGARLPRRTTGSQAHRRADRRRRPAGPPAPAAPLRQIIRRPGVIPALLAGFASMGVMVSVMNLTGYVVVVPPSRAAPDLPDHPGARARHSVCRRVLFVGAFIDRIGRTTALAGGLAMMAVSCAGIQFFEGVAMTAVLLFGLGLGWNLSFVAATAQLADRVRRRARHAPRLQRPRFGAARGRPGAARRRGARGGRRRGTGARGRRDRPAAGDPDLPAERSGGGRIRTSEG